MTRFRSQLPDPRRGRRSRPRQVKRVPRVRLVTPPGRLTVDEDFGDY